MLHRVLIVFITLIATLIATTHTAFAELLKDRVMYSDGIERSYDIYVPDNAPTTPSPLVVLLHGHMGDADDMTGESGNKAPYKVWLSIAEREGWFLVIPDGAFGSDSKRGWNDCRANAKTNPNTDDVKFLNALVDNMALWYPIDRNRVYAHGTSNGGNMAYRLAQESGDTFRAVAAVVAAMPDKNKCRQDKEPVSVLIMNGTDDPILPYEGGSVGKTDVSQKERGTVLSAEESLAYWLNRNGIESNPIAYDYPNVDRWDSSTVHVRQYRNGNDNSEVMLYEVRGGGHTEPSLTEHYSALYKLIVGRQNRDLEMAEVVWAFFNRH